MDTTDEVLVIEAFGLDPVKRRSEIAAAVPRFPPRKLTRLLNRMTRDGILVKLVPGWYGLASCLPLDGPFEFAIPVAGTRVVLGGSKRERGPYLTLLPPRPKPRSRSSK